MAYIGDKTWIPGTRKANFRLSHLNLLFVSRMEGNLISVAVCFFVLIAWTVPSLNHSVIVRRAVLTSSVEKTILILIKLIMKAAGFGFSIILFNNVPGNENIVGNVSLPQEPLGGRKV